MKFSTMPLRYSLIATAWQPSRAFVALMLAGCTYFGPTTARAATWSGATSTNWNTFSNWSGSTGGSGTATIISIPANVPTITADINPVPTAILVGNTTAARVNHHAGNASMSAGNDLVLGRTTGGNGTYNLANTAATGGTLTAFGQGSGNLTVPDQVFVGGSVGAGSGTLNIHTTGTCSVGTQLLVGNLGGTGAVKMDSGTVTVATDLLLGNGTGSTGTFGMSGGSLSVTGLLDVGISSGGNGTFTISGGSVTAASSLEIGVGTGSTGTFSMTGGTVTKSGTSTAVTIGGGVSADGGNGTANLNGGTFTTAGVFRIGQDLATTSAPVSNGTLNLGGTNLTVNAEFWVGNNTGATGTMNFSGGSLTVNNWSIIGRKDDANTGAGATGLVTMTGGTWTKSGESNFVVGDTGSGTMNMSGGLVIVTPHITADRGITWVGNRNNCTGTLTISGSAEFRSPRIVMGVQTGAAGTLNLNGGTVKTTGFAGGAGNSTVNFNGTQIIATSANTAFINALTTANVDIGGLKVDTNGFDLTAAQVLTGGGGVVKTGAGTLTLTGANTYSGGHAVSAGKLAVTTDYAGVGDFTISNGAAMGVIQSWDSSVAVGNVTLGSSGAASLDISLVNDFGNPTFAPLGVNGTLTLNGPITINVSDAQPEIGTIPLVNYTTKAGTGSFVLGKLPLGVSATLTDDGAGLVSLNVTSIDFPLWQGTVDGNWDTTTGNWMDQLTSMPLIYQNPLPAAFDDSATGPTAITLNTVVAPDLVTFNNSLAVYSLDGTGKITGSGGLTKSGTAGLTINTANDYTGVTTLSGGVTSVASLSNGGSASSIGAATASPTHLVLSGGILDYTGAATTINRGFTIGAAGGGIRTTNDLTISGQVLSTAGGGGNFRKQGAGNLAFTYGGTNTFGVGGQAVYVEGGTMTLDGTAGGQTNNVVAEMWVATVPDVPAHLNLINTSLSMSSWLAIARGNGDNGVCNMTVTNSTLNTGNFSSGYNNGLANNACESFVTLTNSTWTNTGLVHVSESAGSTSTVHLVNSLWTTDAADFDMSSNANTAGNLTISGTSEMKVNKFLMATAAGSTANVTIEGNGKLNKTGGNWMSIGTNGNGVGTMTVRDNAVLINAAGDFNVGDVGTSQGTINIQNNASVSSAGVVFVGKNNGTTGTLNMTGGTFNSVTWVTIGRYAGGTGFFNLSGGTVNQTDTGAGFIVGENGTGTLTVSGTGTLNIDGGGLYLSAEGRGTSVSKAYLNGGTIIAKRVVQRDFSAANYTEFHFNGGILRAHSGASTDFMSAHDLVNVDAGGAFIDSNGQSITISQALGGTGSLAKQGTGTLTLSGANTYTGNTTVNAGTLSLSSAYLSDTSTVTIAAGAVLNLTHGLTDQVAGLTIGVTPLAVGTYDATTHPGVITGTGKLQVTGAVASAYDTWIAGYPSIPVADRDPGDDPDKDGFSNALEFALGGAPNSGGSRPGVYSMVADSSADGDSTKELLMTISVRSGTPAFTGSPVSTATQDGYTYRVEGGASLSGFTTAVIPVSPVVTGLPSAPSGYEYRSFSLSGSNGTPGKGFMRVGVVSP